MNITSKKSHEERTCFDCREVIGKETIEKYPDTEICQECIEYIEKVEKV